MVTGTPTLDERIKSIRAEIDAVIDAHAAELFERMPGVPVGVIRQTLIGIEPCQCAAFAALSEKGVL